MFKISYDIQAYFEKFTDQIKTAKKELNLELKLSLFDISATKNLQNWP